MRIVNFFLIVFLTLSSVASGGQKAGSLVTPAQFAALDTKQKTAQLATLLRHEVLVDPKILVQILGAALADPDARIRQIALATISSRATAPAISAKPEALTDWFRDRTDLLTLRGAINAALNDRDEGVRAEAVSALMYLDYDATQPAVLHLSEATERSLEAQFRRDTSSRVRGSIASAFWRASSPPSELGRAIFLDAVNDKDATVRLAAVSGVNRLPTEVAIPLLIAALNDESPRVRGSVANLLSKRVADARPYRAQIEAVASTELDHATRSQMERLVALLRAGN